MPLSFSTYRSQFPPTWFGRNKIWILSLSGLVVVLLIIIICATSFSGPEPEVTSKILQPSRPLTATTIATATEITTTTPENWFNVTAPKGKLLVVTGYPLDNVTETSEVIDLEYPNSQCQSWGSYPEQVAYAVGGFVNGKPLICGGFNQNNAFTNNSCQVVGNSKIKINMTTNRRHASSIVINKGRILWITGGRTQIYAKFNSTEFVSIASGRSDPGPDLPQPLGHHCILSLDESTAVVIGGQWRSETTWFYSFESGVWTSGPNLTHGRHDHVCGAMKDSLTGKRIAVTTTGYTWHQLSHSNTTELLLQGTDRWILGPEVPSLGIEDATGTTSSDGKHFILAGGQGSHYQELYSIFHLQCFNFDCVWTMMDQTLNVARAYHVAMLIPDEVANCTR